MNEKLLTNNQEFAILANLTRSLDKSHVDKNVMHLISSVCLFKGEYLKFLELDNLKNSLISTPNNENLYIFMVYPRGSTVTNNKNLDIIYSYNNINIININIDHLLINFGFLFQKNNLLLNIFGDYNQKHKDLNTISQQCIFIFKNLM